jgi:hypothetical protein
MHEAHAMKIGERVDDRAEHFAGFGRRERAFGENFGEHLFRMFRDLIDEKGGVNLISAALNQANEMRMSERGGELPGGDAGFRILSIGRDKLDVGLFPRQPVHLREEGATGGGGT